MKYINTLKNLKSIMEYAPELVKYEETDGLEKYTYEDNQIYFDIYKDENFMAIFLNKETAKDAIYYNKKDGAWEFDSKASSKITGKNKEIRSIVKSIREDAYIPVSEREERDLTQDEKVQVLNWIKETANFERNEVAEFTLDIMKNEEYTAEGTFRNGQLINVALQKDLDGIHVNGLNWALDGINHSRIYGVLNLDGKSNLFSGEAEYIKTRTTKTAAL